MLNSMKTVKLYCWEAYFDRLIRVARSAEISKIWNTQLMRGLLTSVFLSGTKLIFFAAFLVFMYSTTAQGFSGLVATKIKKLKFQKINCQKNGFNIIW